MGNCYACLSGENSDDSSRDHHQEDPLLLTSKNALSTSLLKLSLHGNNNNTGSLGHDMQGGFRFSSVNSSEQQFVALEAAATDPRLATEKQLKLNKKVRFADEFLLISASSHQKLASVIRFSNDAERSSFRGMLGANQSSNIGRVKVAMSRKELSELLLNTRGNVKDSILVSFPYSINTVSQTLPMQQLYNGRPAWRPSLEYIAEEN